MTEPPDRDQPRVGLPAEGTGSSGPTPHPHIDIDRDSLERDLAGLVLAIVELVRQLMERQAIRRVEQGDLTDEQIERIGSTLMALEERMSELRDHFGLTPEDVNIDLGPLGPLLPRD